MPGSADLAPQPEGDVTSLVKNGRNKSRSEVLREGVRLVEERETRLAALAATVARGLANAEAGRVMPIRDVADRLSTKYRAVTDTAVEGRASLPPRRKQTSNRTAPSSRATT